MVEQKKKKILSTLRYKNFKNSLIVLFIVVSFVGYIVFFASPFYMVNVGDLKYTDFSKIVSMENRDIQILNWTYSKQQKRMEVEIQVDNKSFDGRDTYNFSVMFRPSDKAVKITKILEEANYIVLQIDGIPKSFKEISLRMEVENTPTEQIRLYSNVDQITYEEKIEPMSPLEYHMRRIERNIVNYNNEITGLDAEIQALENKITNIQTTNLRLEESKKYQTTAEMETTNRTITENLNTISELEKEIDGFKQKQQDIQNLIAQSNERLNELKK